MLLRRRGLPGPQPRPCACEGPVPARKLYGAHDACYGSPGASYGLPRFSRADFRARLPFATVTLGDDQVPLMVELTGWSPFTPGDADNSSLPVAALEYRFTNPGPGPVDAVFSYHARNFMALKESTSVVRSLPGGFIVGKAVRLRACSPLGAPWRRNHAA